MRRLSLIVLLSVWVAVPSSSDVLGDASVRSRADFSSSETTTETSSPFTITLGPSAPETVPTTTIYMVTITLTDGTTIVGEGASEGEAQADAAAIYYNSVVEIPNPE